jgi:quercetin dioxygenase-like cupin family protein
MTRPHREAASNAVQTFASVLRDLSLLRASHANAPEIKTLDREFPQIARVLRTAYAREKSSNVKFLPMPKLAVTNLKAIPESTPQHADSTPQPAPRRTKSVVDLWIGQQLRQLRQARGKSLAEIASACGISVALLSQIERGLKSISVRTLNAVANELGVAAQMLLRESADVGSEANGHVARAGGHVVQHFGVLGSREILTPRQARGLGMRRCALPPGSTSGDGTYVSDEGEVVGVVLDGSLEVSIDNHVVLLQAGDSFTFTGATPRSWRNPSSRTTELMIAFTRTGNDAGSDEAEP